MSEYKGFTRFNHQTDGSQSENREPEHIIEEKEYINNFLDHYELFYNECSIDLDHKEIVQLYTAYLNQRRDSL